MKWPRACPRPRCHNTLVDPRIPAAALRAANPVLVKGSLNSRVTLSAHILTSCKSPAWAHTLNRLVLCANMCIPGAWTHTPTASVRCTCYPLQCSKCVFFLSPNLCYSWHRLCYSSSDSEYFFHQGSLRCHQTGNLTSTLTSVVICLYVSGLNSISPPVTTCLSEFFPALQTWSPMINGRQVTYACGRLSANLLQAANWKWCHLFKDACATFHLVVACSHTFEKEGRRVALRLSTPAHIVGQ